MSYLMCGIMLYVLVCLLALDRCYCLFWPCLCVSNSWLIHMPNTFGHKFYECPMNYGWSTQHSMIQLIYLNLWRKNPPCCIVPHWYDKIFCHNFVSHIMLVQIYNLLPGVANHMLVAISTLEWVSLRGSNRAISFYRSGFMS